MIKILIILSVCLSLTGCLEEKIVIKDEPQTQSIEKALATIPGITPNSVIAYPYWLNKQTLAIDFLAYKIGIAPIFGTVINLGFDAQILEYVSYKKGNFLERGGLPTGNQKPVYMISPAASTDSINMLIIGTSLFRGTPGVTGSGRLLTLHFKSKQSAATEIVLAKAKLKGLQAEDISQINWPASIPIQPGY
ncbi:MAG: hypothetical protein HZA78_01950 [Candidatus Schekmanbacteria bacterium]|nr:hypothetical protein [Candidatus Schekmanbacteria bacterium]